jgi:1-deoxy-D-xylulose-5-phosphate synthase
MISLLDTIQSPDDIRQLSVAQLAVLSDEIRLFLLETLHDVGGHLGAGLGVVELTVALHYVFHTPEDRLLWDVGHQAYPHKILTGRRHLLHTIRQKNGLAPFPRREESPYDAFGVGHSSTSISAALGMAMAARALGQTHRHVAVIGDGAMTAGMAFEALNHAGDTKCNLLVVLNDNDMSISRNVGALSHYFSRLLASKWYRHIRQGGEQVLEQMPPMKEWAKRTKTHLKGMIVPGTIFEEMGVRYIGPIDGYNIPLLVETLQNMKDLPGPHLLHVITQKGKGYAPAEADPIGYHAVSKGFYRRSPAKDMPQHAPTPITSSSPTYSEVFGEWLCAMAEHEPTLMAITPAMCEGSGMVEFAKRFPHQYVDVGIAEQHSVTLAAGMATAGIRPVLAIYSSFLQRGYDQLIHDVAIQNLPVLFALDRAGLVPDGPTHSGQFDLSFLRCIPNLVIMAPSDENECWHLLSTGFYSESPATVRYPRGKGINTPIERSFETYPIGKAHLVQTGHTIAFLSFGTVLPAVLKAAHTLGATVVDMRFVKPLDEACILNLADHHTLLVTVEENSILGGAGSGVLEVLAAHHRTIAVLPLGLPDYFVEHGSQDEMRAHCGFTEAGILKAVQEKVSGISCKILQNPVEFGHTSLEPESVC